METLTFAAKLIYRPGDPRWQRPGQAPERVRFPNNAYVVKNPFTGRVLWLSSGQITNIVDGVAAVRLEAAYSGRLTKAKAGYREFINPVTGNTFQVKTAAIIKETS